MDVDQHIVTTGRKRLVQIFRYLEALNQLRNPAKRQIQEQLWVLWLRDLPHHPDIQRGVLSEARGGADTEEMLSGDDFVLKVRRPTLTQAPPPPSKIRDWVRPGWDDPTSSPGVYEIRNETNSQGNTVLRRFEDDPERPRLLKVWASQRLVWAEKERPAREALKTFERLYELHGMIRREEERVELVLGDGILNWRRPEGGIHHPILLQRVQLDFDPGTPEFIVTEADHHVELYSALFRSISDVDGKKIGECRDELDRSPYHPLEGKGTSGFLRRLVQTLSSRGEFLGDGEPKGEADHPRIGRDTVLFMRTRTLGFATALEGILNSLEARTDLPSSLLKIVGIEPPPGPTANGAAEWVVDGNEDEQVLLSKPANPEQLQLAQRLDAHGCVLVQGPPGTGKTHTIGNLLGHLLATGNRVLVTSHTTKALRMVREHVVPQLQPLCVSVLESDAGSRDQLKHSIEGIVEKSSTDVERLEHEAKQFDQRRKDILARIRITKERILDARANEYRDVVFGGASYPPSDAAREVAKGRGEHDWIPGSVSLGTALPLSVGEMLDLYRTNGVIHPDDEQELLAVLPVPDALLTPFDFEHLLGERSGLEQKDCRVREDLWDSPPHETAQIDEIELLLQRLTVAVEGLQEGGWRLAAIDAGRLGSPNRDPWIELVALIQAVNQEAGRAEAILLKHGPRLATDIPFEDQLRVLDEILRHLETGGGLSTWVLLMHGEWKVLLPRFRVGSVQPSRMEHFQALRTLVRLRMARQNLVARWERQITALGGPSGAKLGTRPEATCLQYCSLLTDALNWHATTWSPGEAELAKQGFRWKELLSEIPPNHAPHGDLLRLRTAVVGPLREILAARMRLIRLRQIDSTLATLARQLDLSTTENHRARVVEDLREAVGHGDPNAYRQAFARLVELWNRKSDLEVRRQLLGRLEPVAPGWAAAVRDRRAPHDRPEPPGDPVAAWRWKQLHEELEARSKTSLDELMSDVARLSSTLRKVTADLIDRRAWSAQIRRTDLERRQALNGWLKTVQKIGKGTGKRVPLLQAEARKLMDKCQAAVPVWVMPLARVVESFDPRQTRFDVAIIDEASQSDVMSLIALYMADRVVVVGDDEQVSPEAVGLEITTVQNLIDEHLRGIPNGHLYDGKCSIYDLAFTAFGGTICLREHFRCVPEIIQFSNELSYRRAIKPLRDASLVTLKPHVIAYRVHAAESPDKVNEREALAVASLILACCEQPEYAKNDEGKPVTFGVISLVGEEQARRVEVLLRGRLPPIEYERRRIICGNAAHFQGDERDVMFLSVVDTPRNGPLSLRAEPLFKKRFNVAASRGRDQMWVVHSLNPQSDLKPDDLRRRLIEHALDPHALARLLDEQLRKVDQRSVHFEGEVLRRLIERGYRVIPQLSVGYYRIDMVVEGGGRRLAVECDGDRYHPLDRLPEDMARQAILERLGWTFVRIRGSVFFRDPERAMKPVFTRLAELGIPAEGAGSHISEPIERASELKDRVVRRAEELVREWTGTDVPSNGSGVEGAPGKTDKESDPRPTRTPVGPFSDSKMNNPANWEALFLWAKRELCLSPKQETFALQMKNALERRTHLSSDQCSYGEVVFRKAMRLGFMPPCP